MPFVLPRIHALSFALVILGGLCSCAVPVAEQPHSKSVRTSLNTEARAAILRLGKAGDWLVVRKYNYTDNMVSVLRNAPLSHVALLDLERAQVIEANGTHGVHATPLVEFIDHCHRLILIKPKWATPVAREAAVTRARALIGRKYDFLGLAGINVQHRYYCSELAVELYPTSRDRSEKIPNPVAPDQLYFYGTMLYDSGIRQ